MCFFFHMNYKSAIKFKSQAEVSWIYIIPLNWYILTLDLFIQEYDILPFKFLNFLDNYLFIMICILLIWHLFLWLSFYMCRFICAGTHTIPYFNLIFFPLGGCVCTACTMCMWKSGHLSGVSFLLPLSGINSGVRSVWWVFAPLSHLTRPSSLFFVVLNLLAPLQQCWQHCICKYLFFT